ncbi:MAG: pyrroloquinoline quinone biosynthesis peptide chaperone PqqD [Pseudomonadota bacterium]
MSALDAEAVPRLPRGVRLREDPNRGWILLGPERVLKLDAIAAAILSEVDGDRSFSAIVDRLAKRYAAPAPRIAADAGAMLRGLAEKRLLEIEPPESGEGPP